MNTRILSCLAITWFSATPIAAQPPLSPRPEEIKQVMDRVFEYVNAVTPAQVVNRKTGLPITDLKRPDINADLAKGEFRIITHEWGLAYNGMLLASEVTGDPKFRDYVAQRFKFLGDVVPYFQEYKKAFPAENNPLHELVEPHSLDDAGSMCAAMFKASTAGVSSNLKSVTDHAVQYIMSESYRMADGTFARNRPFPNSVWVDDLYQGISALIQAGKTTRDAKYFDESIRQLELFAAKMFNKEKGLYLHGWIEGMDRHPEFFWTRANGWTMLAVLELLDALPENHPKRSYVLDLFRSHVHGVSALQSGSGLWHQLMNRNDTFLETSSTAMFTFCLAHGIYRGWISADAYGPVARQAWSALATKVNAKGQVEGTCAGTSLGFDAPFYYNRPVGTGPHGYGPVLLAGAAMIRLLKN